MVFETLLGPPCDLLFGLPPARSCLLPTTWWKLTASVGCVADITTFVNIWMASYKM
jgi:hypothetical protein